MVRVRQLLEEVFAGREDRRWRYDRQGFHEFFSQVSVDLPELFEGVRFYNRTDGRFSPDLETALSELRAMGVLRSWGSEFNPQEYGGRARASDERVRELSTRFYERFGVAQTISRSA